MLLIHSAKTSILIKQVTSGQQTQSMDEKYQCCNSMTVITELYQKNDNVAVHLAVVLTKTPLLSQKK